MSQQTESEISNLDPLDRKIVELIIKEPTITDSELSRKLKVNRATIAKHKNKQATIDLIKDIQMTPLQLYQEQQAEAIKVLSKLMKSENEYVRLQAADKFVKSLQTLKIDADLKHDTPPQVIVNFVKPDSN